MNSKNIIFTSIIAIILSIVIIVYINNIADNDFVGIIISFLGGIFGMAISVIILTIYRIKNRSKGNIFISYSYKDKEFADKLITSLRNEHFNIIFDRDKIEVGDDIQSIISDSIYKSDLMILILSSSIKEKYRNLEIKCAIDNNKKILPVYTGAKKTKFPAELEGVKYADFSQNYDNGIKDLTQSMIVALDSK